MDSTIIAIGALFVSAAAVAINLWLALRKKQKEDNQQSAALLEAENQVRLGSVQAAQKVIDMYGEMLQELRERVLYLERRVRELEVENNQLRTSLNGYDH